MVSSAVNRLRLKVQLHDCVRETKLVLSAVNRAALKPEYVKLLNPCIVLLAFLTVDLLKFQNEA